MSKIKKDKKAFTLIEMMVVVILIGIIYSLVLTHGKAKKKEMILFEESPFKALLLPYWNHSKVSLVCINHCKKCYIYNQNLSLVAKDIKLPVSYEDIDAIYTFATNGDIRKADFVQLDKQKSDESVCLRYDLYPNLSSSELFIEEKNATVLYMPAFFDKVVTFASIEDAKNYFEDLKIDLIR